MDGVTDQFNSMSGHPSTWPAEVETLQRRVTELEEDLQNALKLLHNHADPFNMPQEDVAAWDKLQEKGLNT